MKKYPVFIPIFSFCTYTVFKFHYFHFMSGWVGRGGDLSVKGALLNKTWKYLKYFTHHPLCQRRCFPVESEIVFQAGDQTILTL